MALPPSAPRRAWLLPALVVVAGLAGWLLLRERPATHDDLAGGTPRRAPPQAPAPSDLGAPATSGGGAQPAGGAAPRAPTPARMPTVAGRVLDANERPVVGARVTLHAVEHGAWRGLAVADGEALGQVETDPDGAFELVAPRSGSARVRAAAPGLGTSTRLVTPAGARLTLVLAREAVLDVEARTPQGAPVGDGEVEVEGAAALARATLLGGRARVEGLAPGTARVRVRLPDGQEGHAGPVLLEPGTLREVRVVVAPLARLGGVVRAAESDEPLADASVIVAAPGRLLAQATSDAAGRFGPLAVALPGEGVVVSVAAPGRRSALVPLAALPRGAEPAEVLVRLEAAEPWSGRVEDAQGAAAGGVEVGYTADGVVGRVPAATVTDAEGRFTLPPPPPPAPGRRVVLLAQGAAGRAAWALRPDTPRPEALVLRLTPGSTLRARVRDERARPIEGALLRVSPAWEAQRATREADDLLHAVNATGGALTGLSDDAGEVAVAGLSRGPWRVVLEHAGQTRDVATLVEVAEADLDLGTLVVGGGLTLDGEVRDSAGRPAAGVRVRATALAEAGSRPQVALTDPAGRFRLTDLAPGRVALEAEGPAGPSARVEVALPAADPVRLELEATRRLKLTVSAPQGPYDGWLTLLLLRPRQAEGAAWRQSLPVEGGRAIALDVPPGTWMLRAEAAGLVAAPGEPLTVRGEADARVALRLEAPARLEGRLVNAQGLPVAGGELVLKDLERQGNVRTLSDAQGRWSFDGLAPGEHALTARGAGGASIATRVSLRANAPTSLDLALAPAGTLAVRVVDAEGRPVAGALVAVRAAQAGVAGATAQGRSDAQGRLTLADLAAAPVVLSARLRDGRQAQQQVSVVAGRVLDLELRVTRP